MNQHDAGPVREPPQHVLDLGYSDGDFVGVVGIERQIVRVFVVGKPVRQVQVAFQVVEEVHPGADLKLLVDPVDFAIVFGIVFVDHESRHVLEEHLSNASRNYGTDVLHLSIDTDGLH